MLEDDPEAFAFLHASLLARYAPEDELEEKMVERLALLWCRLDRVSIHAQHRLAEDLTPRVDPDRVAMGFDAIPEAKEPVDALLRCESVCAAEARLERSISRLLRDLDFLARFRNRSQRDAHRPTPDRQDREPRQGVGELMQSGLAPTASPVDAAWAVAASGPNPAGREEIAAAGDKPANPEGTARNATSGEGDQAPAGQPASVAPGVGPAVYAHEAWLPAYEIERRRRLGWKPAPDIQ
jgi:hypothetical protein